MGRKAKAIVDQTPPEQSSKPTPKLTAAQYWEFRCSINDIDVAMKNVEIAKLVAKIKEMELSEAKEKVNAVSVKYINAKKEYDEFLSKLEKELGTTIKGKIIDPITFSIKSDDEIAIPD